MHTPRWMPAMLTPTMLLVTGASVAALILALGKANAYFLQVKLEELELACMAAVLNEEDVADAPTPSCDPLVLIWTETPRHPYRGIQGEIIVTQTALWRQQSVLTPVIGTILGLTATFWPCAL